MRALAQKALLQERSIHPGEGGAAGGGGAPRPSLSALYTGAENPQPLQRFPPESEPTGQSQPGFIPPLNHTTKGHPALSLCSQAVGPTSLPTGGSTSLTSRTPLHPALSSAVRTGCHQVQGMHSAQCLPWETLSVSYYDYSFLLSSLLSSQQASKSWMTEGAVWQHVTKLQTQCQGDSATAVPGSCSGRTQRRKKNKEQQKKENKDVCHAENRRKKAMKPQTGSLERSKKLINFQQEK